MTYDEGLMLVNTTGHHAQEHVYQQLYDKATWIFSSSYAEDEDIYHFSSCWMDPSQAQKESTQVPISRESNSPTQNKPNNLNSAPKGC
jgi:hypothetical protein